MLNYTGNKTLVTVTLKQLVEDIDNKEIKVSRLWVEEWNSTFNKINFKTIEYSGRDTCTFVSVDIEELQDAFSFSSLNPKDIDVKISRRWADSLNAPPQTVKVKVKQESIKQEEQEVENKIQYTTIN
jgi:hypothetical protein